MYINNVGYVHVLVITGINDIIPKKNSYVTDILPIYDRLLAGKLPRPASQW